MNAKHAIAIVAVLAIICVVVIVAYNHSEDNEWKDRVTSDIHKDYPGATSIECSHSKLGDTCFVDGSFLYKGTLYNFLYTYTNNGGTWYLTNHYAY